MKITWCESEVRKICPDEKECQAKFDFIKTVSCERRDDIFRREDERLVKSA